MDSIISIENLAKTYANGFVALKSTSLDIRRGEILGCSARTARAKQR